MKAFLECAQFLTFRVYPCRRQKICEAPSLKYSPGPAARPWVHALPTIITVALLHALGRNR
jgi:hypothetical protein